MIAAYHHQTDQSVTRYLAEKDEKCGKPLRLFRQGKDYLEIAILMEISEAEVERRIHVARSNETRKQARFGGRV
jgi:DNA-directed RNA polymerase specialized sigma24 family protein